MIKKVLMFAALLMCFRYIHGQGKPLIDTTVRKWPYISRYDVALSNNGQYATYIIFNQPVGANSLVIQHLRGQWKKTIIRNNIEILFFSSNNHYLCWNGIPTVN